MGKFSNKAALLRVSGAPSDLSIHCYSRFSHRYTHRTFALADYKIKTSSDSQTEVSYLQYTDGYEKDGFGKYTDVCIAHLLYTLHHVWLLLLFFPFLLYLVTSFTVQMLCLSSVLLHNI